LEKKTKQTDSRDISRDNIFSSHTIPYDAAARCGGHDRGMEQSNGKERGARALNQTDSYALNALIMIVITEI
jgi:hypothetical protein